MTGHLVLGGVLLATGALLVLVWPGWPTATAAAVFVGAAVVELVLAVRAPRRG
ncbi:hypothetical protein ACFS27_03445 [Promicromonospora vindobonensis]|uniref:Uncharacterized protein n=1 Tax=Promicromonospora vindobonensis TaxID=195748 RepID=A0ABW5VRG6_9MICO